MSIIQGKENFFVGMPSYKTKKADEDNKPIYQDVCHPVTKEFREMLFGTILETYRQEREKRIQDVEQSLKQNEGVQKKIQKQATKSKERVCQ